MKKFFLLLLCLTTFFSFSQSNCNFINSSASQQCINGGSQAIIVFQWSNAPGSCEVTSVSYSNAEGAGPFTYPIGQPPNVPSGNFGVYAGPGNGQPANPNWSVEHYLVLNYANGTQSDTIAYTPYACIPGCMDSNSISFNPWATVNNGACVSSGGGGANCAPEDHEITVEITLDSYPNETSWQLISLSDGGIVAQATQGDYDFGDIGQTYTYTVCIDTLGVEFVINDSFGDGLAGSTTGGSVDGNVVIYNCDGDTIWELPVLNFQNQLNSGPVFGSFCSSSPPIFGCTDPTYQEFDPNATVDDGSCANLHVYGCIDTNAYNYNPNATMMEIYPTCNYELWIGDAAADGWGNSYIGVTQGSNLWAFTMGPGSYSQTFPLTLDTDKPVEIYYFEVSGPQQPPQEVEFQTWQNSFKLTNDDGVVLIHEGSNPFANNGQGALQPFEAPFYEKYQALPFCGDLCVPIILGCTDSTALNFDPNANTNDGSCIPIIYGCTNSLAFNYDPLATVDDGSCIPIIVGCMDPISWNYNPLANIDDGSCIYFGCTDSTALNYDPNANVDNGTCIYPIYGCTDPTAFNYDPNANVDDGSCIPVIYGCMDPTMFNYDPLANTDNGSCIPFIFGCTDSTALNYDPTANTDNGTCILPIPGCTDPNAYNYDPTANVPDSTACLYDAGCITGPGNPYWLNDGCYAWVIDVDSYCCTVAWDESCQSMYDYCQLGWPAGMDDISSMGIMVFPNPTDNTLNIKTHLSITYELRDMMGKLILTGGDKSLELGQYEDGVYILTLIHKEKRFSKRIIKQ